MSDAEPGSEVEEAGDGSVTGAAEPSPLPSEVPPSEVARSEEASTPSDEVAAISGGAPYRRGDPPPVKRPVHHRALSTRDLAAWLGLVVLVDVATWQAFVFPGVPTEPRFGLGGFGSALLLLGIPAMLILAAGRVRRSPRLLVLGAVLGALSLRTLILPAFSTTLAALVALAAVPLALRTRRFPLPAIAAGWLHTIVAIPSRAGAAFEGLHALASRSPMSRTRVLSVLVPLIASLAFVGVFALANPLVASGLAWIGALFGHLALPHLSRVFIWCVVAGVGLLALRPAIRLAEDDEAAKAATASELELLVARNTLVATNVVFVAYLGLDAAYLFDGRPPSGMSTQAYAHQGALWLTVALVMLTGVIGVLFRGALQSDPRASTSRKLAYAWAGSGLLLALGTYQRIAIHITRSGLSDLRIVGILGTTLVVVGMVLTLEKLRRGRSLLWLMRRQLDAFALTFVVYALLPTHYLAAEVNVARIAAGEYGPLLHLAPEARHVESVAVLLPLLDHPDVRVREGVASILSYQTACIPCAISDRTWNQRDLASEPVSSMLEAADPRIEAALGDADPVDARRVLSVLGERAAEGWDEERLAVVPPAHRARAAR